MALEDDISRIVRSILNDHVYDIFIEVTDEPKENSSWRRPHMQKCWTCPQIGHTIEVNGFEYEVIGVHHSLDNYINYGDGEMEKHRVSVKVKCLNPDYKPYRW